MSATPDHSIYSVNSAVNYADNSTPISQPRTPLQQQQQLQQQQIIDFINLVLPVLPFLLILTLAYLPEHLTGLLLSLLLSTLFVICNEAVIRLNAKSHSDPHFRLVLPCLECLPCCLWLLGCQCLIIYLGLFCLTTVVFVLYIFNEQSLWLSLICLPPTFSKYDFWSLLFTTAFADLLLKFIVMSVKLSALWFLSGTLFGVAVGRINLIIERFYQFYRHFLPIGIWYATLLFDEFSFGSSSAYSKLLVICYAICKIRLLYGLALPLAVTLHDLIRTPVPFNISIALSNNIKFSAIPVQEFLSCSGCDQPTLRISLACGHTVCLPCLIRSLPSQQRASCTICGQMVAPFEAGVGGPDAILWMSGATMPELQLF